jgi:tetratricopeptide (TPR) repeat protein
MGDLLHLALYNPAILKDEDFLAGFVARRELVDDILVSLQTVTRRSLAKHRIILGQRGMGKTSLLRRIALGVRDDSKLSEMLLPLTFREEQYNVHNLHTLWCNCLDALGDYFEQSGQHEKAKKIDKDVTTLSRQERDSKDKEEGEAALAVLKEWAKREGKRLLLLLDSINLILDGLKESHWTLRRTLQEAGGIIVIGASAYYLEATSDPKGAFYDFFQVTVLERLDQEELLTCLRRLAQVRGEEGGKVLQVLNENPGRIRTLSDLTGGNPRTLILLYLLLERDAGGDVMNDLEHLLDQVTVLYKARVEDLAPQARIILDAMALAWNPVTAADLSSATSMDTSAVSSQIDRLFKNGIVEKVSISTTDRTAFQVAERFFNIWYLMRHGQRRQRTRLRWLTSFLRGFYSPQQLKEKVTDILRKQSKSSCSNGHYYLALCEAIEDTGLRNLLGQEARRELETMAAAQGKRLDELVDTSDLPEPKTALEWRRVGLLLDEQLGRYAEAEDAYHHAINLDPNDANSWNNLGRLLEDKLCRYEEAETAYHRAIEIDPKDNYSWITLGDLLADRLGRYEEAETAVRHAIEIESKDTLAWNDLGRLLADRLDRYEEAETAFRRVLEVDPKDTFAWNNLGILLANRLDRYEEAEAAYRRAIEIDPKYFYAWNNLGNLLANRLDRYEEAEAAFRRVLEVDPKDTLAWNNLGNLLANRLGRYEEAEAAFRHTIEIDPKDTYTWNNLGDLLADRLGRYEEAEAAFRHTIEIDPKDTYTWNNLGDLLADRLGRYEEAEAAFRRVLEVDPKDTLAWNNLGNLLADRLGRYEEAEAAFRHAIEIDPKDTYTWNNLGDLLANRLGRYEEAEAAFRRAIEIDSETVHSWCSLGYVYLYFLNKPKEAELAYKTVLRLRPEDLVAESNLLVIYLIQPNRQDEVEVMFDAVVSKHPADGASLLRSIRYLIQNNFKDATTELKNALAYEHDGLFGSYEGFYLLILRLAVQYGFGDKMLVWMDENDFADRYWPLRTAFDAYIHGEERFMDVNPEVRGAAKHIYDLLDSARRSQVVLSQQKLAKKNRKRQNDFKIH